MPCDQPGPVLPEGVYAVRNGEERSLFVAVIDGGKQEGLTLQPGELVIRVIAGGSPSAVGLLVGEDQYVQTVESRRTYCIDTRLAQQGKVFTID